MVFGAFSKTVGHLPSEAIIRALDLECQMLKDDLEHNRLDLDEEATSILYFSQFVKMVKSGQPVRRARFLPLDHLEFYRETIVKLIQAKELPETAMDQFESAFPVS